MAKRFFTDIDLRYNKLLKSVLENIDTTSAASESLRSGRIFFATDTNSIVFYDGNEFRTVLFDGALINPSYINQLGFSDDASVLFSTKNEKDAWNALSNDATNIERTTNKNIPDGYAGLDDQGKLELTALWDGMVILAQDGTSYNTLGELIGQPFGFIQSNAVGLIDATNVDDNDLNHQFVSQVEKDHWNAQVIDGTGFELQANKNQINGYSGLDNNGYIPKENNTDGVVLRAFETQIFDFAGTPTTNDYLIATYNGTSENILVDGTNVNTLSDLIEATRQTFFDLSVLSTITTDGTSYLKFASVISGNEEDIQIQFINIGGGNVTIAKGLGIPAFYDLSNIGGISSIGFAPLNSLGIIDPKYLPNLANILVVNDIIERDALYPDTVSNTHGEGKMVFVVDATDDPTVDSGWATYVWQQTSTSWIKMGESETSIDINHNTTLNMQGDGVNNIPPQAYHLDTAQLERVRNSEYYKEFINIDANKIAPYGTKIFEFDASLFRGCDISISYEDADNKVISATDLKIIFNGIYSTNNESGRLESGNANKYPYYYTVWNDINNYVELFVRDGGGNVSLALRYKFYKYFNNIIIELLPTDDLFINDSLYITLVPTAGTPSVTLTPASNLVPGQ